MGDWVQFVVDERVTAADAPALADRLRDRLIASGWIGPEPEPGGSGHPPGPQVRSWYARRPREGDFTELRTNGVSIAARPFSNLAAGPFDVELLACPACAAPVNLDALHDHIGRWMTHAIEPIATCGRCGHGAHARTLRGNDDRVLVGHLAVTFYDWPPLEDVAWSRRILDVIVEVLGSPPSIAQAKL